MLVEEDGRPTWPAAMPTTILRDTAFTQALCADSVAPSGPGLEALPFQIFGGRPALIAFRAK
ncbi:hypothetical protein [Methylibium sp.]|uniref:hypothetical protein n=1 Tax=Methylibium sp. TaxID=2067992 RepID=UPI001855F1CE|nr:hypothetical protein [Methylibium sp.]MBA3591930.1 hypothetical protein [Methylibium sp.]